MYMTSCWDFKNILSIKGKHWNYLDEVVGPRHKLRRVGLGCENIISLPCFLLCMGLYLSHNDMIVRSKQSETRALVTMCALFGGRKSRWNDNIHFLYLRSHRFSESFRRLQMAGQSHHTSSALWRLFLLRSSEKRDLTDCLTVRHSSWVRASYDSACWIIPSMWGGGAVFKWRRKPTDRTSEVYEMWIPIEIISIYFGWTGKVKLFGI